MKLSSIALVASLAVVPLRAAWPAVIMIYGGSLSQPVFIGPRAIADSDGGTGADYTFLYAGSTERLGKDISGRPFVSLAMFWGGDVWKKADADPAFIQQLKSETANQHGRLYPPFNGEPAVVVATPFMPDSACRSDADGNPVPGLVQRPAPTAVKGFPCGWTLGEHELAVLRSLNIPGF